MEPVQVGIVGLGYWGPNLLRNFALCEQARVRAVCDKRQEQLDTYKRWHANTLFTTNYEDLLKDPKIEALVIATPVSSHFSLAKAALEAGKHVLVEKPLVSSSQEAKELIDLATKQKKILMVDQTFVYEDAVDRMKKYIDDKAIGDLLYYDSTRINLGLIQRDTNVMWDLAIHDLSILNHIRPVTDVTSVLAYGQSIHTKQLEMAHIHIKFQDGFSAHIHVSWLSPVKLRRTLIGGSEKMIVYDDNEPSEKIRLYDKGVTVTKEEQTFALPIYRSGDVVIPRLNAVEPLKVLAAHFCKCVRGEENPKTPASNSERIINILELADQSIQERCEIIIKA